MPGKRQRTEPWKHVYGKDRKYTARVDRMKARQDVTFVDYGDRIPTGIGGRILSRMEGDVRLIEDIRLDEVSLVHTDAKPGQMDAYGAWGLKPNRTPPGRFGPPR